MLQTTELVKKQAERRTILERSLLTSDQVTQVVARYESERTDYARWYVDWKLLDAFKEVWSRDAWRYRDIEELRKSAKDENCTKMFYNYAPTMSNWTHFVDQSVERPSYRWNINLRVAHNLLRKSMQITKLQPLTLSFENLAEIWSNKNASAGAIGRGSKDSNAADCFDAACRIRRAIRDGREFGDIWIPYVQFHRSQIGNLLTDSREYSYAPTFKDRLVLGCDGGSVTIEGLYAKPLISHISQCWYSYSGGDDPYTQRRKIRESRSHKFWVSLDFSKFDQTIQSWLIDDAFSIVKEFYAPKWHQEIDWVCYQFKNSWLVYPGGVGQKHRGIPSGSNFTQVIGSMCNALMILTYLSSRAPGGYSLEQRMDYVERQLQLTDVRNRAPGKYTMFVMGDDNLLFTREKVDVEGLSKYVERVFGTNINPGKTASGDCDSWPKYLKREWRYNGEYRDPLELAINTCHPERERSYEGYSEWHIMFGLWLTYQCAFPKSITWRFFKDKLEANGGLSLIHI